LAVAVAAAGASRGARLRRSFARIGHAAAKIAASKRRNNESGESNVVVKMKIMAKPNSINGEMAWRRKLTNIGSVGDNRDISRACVRSEK
jgi:hypothetical protein